jgi:D-alanyl-D-alanine carboxypeptidase
MVLLAANAACAFLLVRVFFPARAPVPPALASATEEAPAPQLPKPAARPLHNERDARLESRVRHHIDAALSKAREETRGKVQPGEVTVAVHLRELAVPGDVVAIAPERSLRPASNMKLVTTAAALVLLGPEWSFETRFASAAPIEGGHLRGDLVVRAGGDPLYDPEAAGEVEPLLAPALDELARAGVRTIDGQLVLDENGFQPAEPGPSWPAGDRWKEYCALAGGFSANAGCLTATVRAGEGGPAAVELHPRAHGLPDAPRGAHGGRQAGSRHPRRSADRHSGRRGLDPARRAGVVDALRGQRSGRALRARAAGGPARSRDRSRGRARARDAPERGRRARCWPRSRRRSSAC